MKAQKPVKTGRKPVMTIKMPVFKMRRRDPVARINAASVQNIDTSNVAGAIQGLKALQNRIKSEVGEQKEAYALVDDITEALLSPEAERDEEGRPLKTPQGQLQAKGVDIKMQRIANRLLDLIDEAKDVAEEKIPKESADRPEDVDLEIQAKADDVIYLCGRMISAVDEDGNIDETKPGFYDEYGRIAWHVPLAYDLFEDLRAEATKQMSAYNQGKEAPEEIPLDSAETESNAESKENSGKRK